MPQYNDDILDQKITNLSEVEELQRTLERRGILSKNPYKAFYPMVKVTGELSKMHATRLCKHQHLVYLNPIEGIFSTFKSPDQFPHKPNDVFHLDEIVTAEYVREKRLYHSAGNFYMKIASRDKNIVLFDKDFEII